MKRSFLRTSSSSSGPPCLWSEKNAFQLSGEAFGERRVGALLFGATTVFAQMRSALNQMWDVVARPSRSGIVVFVVSRILSLGLVLMIGFLLLMSFALTVAIAALLRFAEGRVPVPGVVVSGGDLILSLALATLLFATIFKFFGAAFIRVSVRGREEMILLRRTAVKVRTQVVEEESGSDGTEVAE